MKAINLHMKHIFRVVFSLTVITFDEVRNESSESNSSPHQQDIDFVRLHEVHYVWNIFQYELPDYFFYLESPTFSADTDDTFKWTLRLEPSGGAVHVKFFGLYLRLRPDSKKTKAWVALNFHIWEDEKRRFLLWNDGFSDLKQIKNNTNGLGFNKIYYASSWFLDNNKIIISCDFQYHEDLPNMLTFTYPEPTIKTTPAPRMNTYNDNHIDKFGSLFNNEKFADIVIIANSTKYPAHKAILAAHSPLFAKIIERSLKKGETLKQLDITNTNERVVVEMLRYIYTGKCENLTCIADQLLVAADTYNLDTLKMICAETLGKLLTVENAAKTLALANKHGTADLKTKVIAFISTKYIEVSNTTDWKRIAKECPELIQDICQHQHVLLNNMQS